MPWERENRKQNFKRYRYLSVTSFLYCLCYLTLVTGESFLAGFGCVYSEKKMNTNTNHVFTVRQVGYAHDYD